jgi:VanZ family protein
MGMTADLCASKRSIVISWALVGVWAAFIFFMSAHTGGDLDTGSFGQIKLAMKDAINAVIGYHDDPVSPCCHFCEYAVFGALLANALRNHMPLGRACLIAIACASAYGVTDEFHQLFVPGRMCDPLDWATDTCGASLGSLIAFLVLRRGRVR